MDAYFEMFSGISGNMTLGSLIDLGLDLELLKSELGKLHLEDEYEITAQKVSRSHIGGTYVDVKLHHHDHDEDHDHHGDHDHHHGRNLEDINKIIDSSELSKNVKEKSKAIFMNLAKAEAKVHRTDINEIHFHEVGAVDAIVDIVGSVIGLEMLGIDRIYASPINTGQGYVMAAHGKLPVPAPATAELLKNVPIYSSGTEKELTTPTGAAIITTLSSYFGPRPLMSVEKIGYGAGTYEIEIPNLLRVSLGRVERISKRVKVIETNIDDMNPQFYESIMEKLFHEGALDVYFTPIQMKKNRPAIKISVIAEEQNVEKLNAILLTETTTLGVRIFDAERETLEREMREVKTKWGKVRVKVGLLNGKVVNFSPEYEDCKKISSDFRVPIKEVYMNVYSSFEL
ncbi:nickel pincer cofactor biosynthesis protein LarC [Athalassotoga saccharophila]|uniref:nickel pincer cofactor biosynthesis protein LarC n=1 Tax=Athalassotoga saccharophila TaxID=1441386 RepID=UPI0018D91586|nr:nickel pincer cofactor biosynthesis protein LarC [Athalassotoga saccharophila]BBJ28846.1 pyridinium-3,5-bisthiocarboxylic acid mononucleotide nickel insertion protein [Athalassotoga saccharophila]